MDCKWYVGYTFPKAEKKVYNKICEMGFESFLPTTKITRQWSDRKKILTVPLFPNYVFVKSVKNQLFKALKIRELVRFISFNDEYAVISDKEIELIHYALNKNLNVITRKEYIKGDKIKVIKGQFLGVEGIITNLSGKKRVIIELSSIQQAVCLDIEMADVELQ